MKKMILFSLLILLVSCSTGNYVRKGFPVLKSVEKVDLARYLGKWYEIARFPFVFEDGLVNTTATYSLLDNGKIRVLNEGYRGTAAGKKETAKGAAWVPDSQQSSKLKVSFFAPFSSDYWVIALDDLNYSYAMVSSGYKYLWILSRTPQMDDTLYAALVEQAAALGFQTEKLYKVPQNWE